MAHDLLSGAEDGRDWSRGDGITDWAARRAAGSIEKKIPWVPIGIGTGIGLLLLLPLGRKRKDEYHVRGAGRTDPTRMIPRESMRELVASRRK